MIFFFSVKETDEGKKHKREKERKYYLVFMVVTHIRVCGDSTIMLFLVYGRGGSDEYMVVLKRQIDTQMELGEII